MTRRGMHDGNRRERGISGPSDTHVGNPLRLKGSTPAAELADGSATRYVWRNDGGLNLRKFDKHKKAKNRLVCMKKHGTHYYRAEDQLKVQCRVAEAGAASSSACVTTAEVD